ncbi:hypothetical protein BRD04_07290 [Halobacteriales archaeon QS_9_67_17]|nr:MAG: hypothetical protein BRD04_07290 [Halobacteriales archaeon QS_9_67_17]
MKKRILFVVLIVLAGCGSAPNGTPTPTATTSPTPTLSPTAPSTPTATSTPDSTTPTLSAFPNAVRVIEIQANTSDGLNGEYVVIENSVDYPINLDGWIISDADNHTYTFGEIKIGPSDDVRVRTGTGTDVPPVYGNNTGTVYWGRTAEVWDDEGDTVTVRDDWGREVTKYSYNRSST